MEERVCARMTHGCARRDARTQGRKAFQINNGPLQYTSTHPSAVEYPGHLFTVSTPPSLFVYSFLPAPSLVLLVSPLIFPSPSGPPPLISRLSYLLSSPLFSYSYTCSRPNKSFIALLWIAKQYKWEVERANE